MAISIKSSNTVALTPAIAAKHRDMPASPTERKLDPKRVKLLSDKIQAGLFITPTWAIADYNGTEVRMNGQHSSHALCDANGLFPTGLSVHIDTYNATDPNDLAVLFRQFDAKQSSRSAEDVSGAYQHLHTDLTNVCPKVALATIKGVAWYLRKIDGSAIPPGDDIGSLFNNLSYHDFIRFCGSLFTSKCKELQRPEVIACMYGTYLVASTASKEFWTGVASGAGDTASTEGILDSQLLADREESDRTSKLKPDQVYGICAKAWNCSRENTPIKGKLYHALKKPLPALAS